MDSWLLLLAACAASVALARFLWLVLVEPLRLIWHYRAQGVPGRRFIPVLGNLPDIVAIRAAKNPLEADCAFFEIATTGLSYHFVGMDFQLRVQDPDFMQEIFVTHSQAFDKPALLKDILVPSLGPRNLVLADNGDVHRRHRKAISPAFQFLRLKDMSAGISAAASRAVDRWLAPLPPAVAASSAAPPPPRVDVDMHAALTSLALGIIGEAAFGVRLDDAAVGGVDEDPAAYRALAGLVSSALDDAFQMTALLPFYNAARHASRAPAVARLRAQLMHVLEARLAGRKTAAGATGADSEATPHLLVDFLLDATQVPVDASSGAAAPLSLGEALDEAVAFVFAGHETTSHALCWTLYHLAKHPEWASAARAEVLQCLGPSRSPTYDDLASMPTVAAVFHESMRLLPAVATTLRVAVRDVTLKRKPTPAITAAAAPVELRVKAGTMLNIGIAAVQRDPALWGPSAAEYDPTRFMAGVAAALPHPMAYAPFTAGPRACIGQHFATLEARIILATLLQRAEWELAPEYAHCPLGNITLVPRHGMPMRVRRVPLQAK